MRRIIPIVASLLICLSLQAQRRDPVSVSNQYHQPNAVGTFHGFGKHYSDDSNAAFTADTKTDYVCVMPKLRIWTGAPDPLTCRQDWLCLADDETGSVMATSNGRNFYWGQVRKKHYSLNNSSFILRKGSGIIKRAVSPTDCEYFFGTWRDDTLYGDVLMMDRKGDIYFCTCKYGKFRNVRPANEEESRMLLEKVDQFESRLDPSSR